MKLIVSWSLKPKTKYWTHLNFDLLVALDEKSGDHQSQVKFIFVDRDCLHKMSQQSNDYWDVSVWTEVVNQPTSAGVG